MTGPAPLAGMVISVRTRRDVVVTDPEKFLATAKQAYLDLNPDATDVDAQVADVHDAAFAIIERDGRLTADEPVHPSPVPRPGDRTLGRPDGLSPAGAVTEIVVDLSHPLVDHGCFPPAEGFFASPPRP